MCAAVKLLIVRGRGEGGKWLRVMNLALWFVRGGDERKC